MTTETIGDLIIHGLQTDGEHHKQWFLAEVARRLGIPLVTEMDDEDLGTPP